MPKHGYVRGGVRVFAEYFWHSEGWTPRNEALMEAVSKQVRTVRHPWLIACDASMCPEDFKKSLWFKNRHMFIEAPGAQEQAFQLADPKARVASLLRERTIICHRQTQPSGKYHQYGHGESRPHKAVTFLVERDKEFQVWREQKRHQDSAMESC